VVALTAADLVSGVEAGSVNYSLSSVQAAQVVESAAVAVASADAVSGTDDARAGVAGLDTALVAETASLVTFAYLTSSDTASVTEDSSAGMFYAGQDSVQCAEAYSIRTTLLGPILPNTTISVYRPDESVAVEERTDDDVLVVASGLRAHLSVATGDTSTRPEAVIAAVRYSLVAEPCDLRATDLIEDDFTGLRYRLAWVLATPEAALIPHVKASAYASVREA
jgi:hypothetical protein